VTQPELRRVSLRRLAETAQPAADAAGRGGSGSWELAARAGAGIGGRCAAVTGKAEAVTSGDGVAGVAPGPAVRPAARRRRPTGAPPPLPHPVSVSTTAWLVAVVVVLAGLIVVSVRAVAAAR